MKKIACLLFLGIILSFIMGQDDCCPPGVPCPQPPSNIATITVKVYTANEQFAGTDDNVYFSINPAKEYWLNNLGENDFEQGNTDVFELDVSDDDLKCSSITEITIRKNPDGSKTFGPWKLGGLEVSVTLNCGAIYTIYKNDNINVWLQGSNPETLKWTAPDYTPVDCRCL